MDITKFSSSTGPPTNREQLKQEALNILEDYFQEVSQTPSSTLEKEALLARIKAIPQCGYYDMGCMMAWFSNRRQRSRSKERALHTDNNNGSGFPSLTPAAIQYLTVLANNQPKPSSELLKTWATLLASTGAKEQDVVDWIHYRNQEHQLQHLPTPSDTTMTPEPLATSQSPTQGTYPRRLYKQETMSPTMPALQLHPFEQAPATPSEPSPTLNKDPMLQLNQHPQVQAIIHGVCDALASPQTTPNAVLKTAAEFETMFFPFEQRISLLLRALETTQPPSRSQNAVPTNY